MLKLLSILLITITADTYSTNLLPKDLLEDCDLFTMKVLEHYDDYVLHLHFDNSTSNGISEFLNGRKNHALGSFIENYDRSIAAPSPFERLDGYKFLHFVFMRDPKQFERYSNVTFNLECTDVVLFVLRSNEEISLSYWSLAGLDKSGSVILYNIETREFYYTQFYCGNLTGVLIKISDSLSTGTQQPSIPNLKSYVNDFKNFQNHKFLVGMISHPPFVWCNNSDSNETMQCDMVGVEGDLLGLMMEWLNFTVSLSSYDGEVANHAHVVQKVHENEVHWAIGGITLTYQRYFDADFGAPLRIESYVALISIPKNQGIQGGYVVLPFEKTAWFCLFIVLLLLSALLKVAYCLNNENNRLNAWEYITIPIKTFLSLSLSQWSVKAETLTLKITYCIMWFVVGIIFSTAYKSKLTSILIKPRIWQPQTIQELVDNNYKFRLMSKEWDVLKESANLTIDSVFMKVLANAKDDLKYCEAIRKTLNEPVAFLQEEIPMQYQILNTCGDELTQNEYETLRIVNERIFPNNHAWPMQLAAPYVHKFSECFLRLQSMGYIARLYQKYDTKRIILKTSEAIHGISPVIKMDHLVDSAFILFLGYVIAIVIFVIERFKGKQ